MDTVQIRELMLANRANDLYAACFIVETFYSILNGEEGVVCHI